MYQILVHGIHCSIHRTALACLQEELLEEQDPEDEGPEEEGSGKEGVPVSEEGPEEVWPEAEGATSMRDVP